MADVNDLIDQLRELLTRQGTLASFAYVAKTAWLRSLRRRVNHSIPEGPPESLGDDKGCARYLS